MPGRVRLLIATATVFMIAGIGAVSAAVSAGASAGRAAHVLGTDPQLAPVIFVPGLVASDISCS